MSRRVLMVDTAAVLSAALADLDTGDVVPLADDTRTTYTPTADSYVPQVSGKTPNHHNEPWRRKNRRRTTP